MPKSAYAGAVDAIQRELKPLLNDAGYRVRGRTFNQVTTDGLTQVVNFQMGPSDPPAATYHPGLRENLYGLFTVNLGVYVPEVARFHGGGEAKSWVQEYQCCVRARLGELRTEPGPAWWRATVDESVLEDLRGLLLRVGLPFLDRFATRDKIVSECAGRSECMGASSPPRIVLALIHATRGEMAQALDLLTDQAKETRNPGHPAYVRALAAKLGLPQLPG